MNGQHIYHVIRREDEIWQVMKEGFSRPHIIGQTKAEAVLLAKRLARANPDARVVVHNDKDLVESVFQFNKIEQFGA